MLSDDLNNNTWKKNSYSTSNGNITFNVYRWGPEWGFLSEYGSGIPKGASIFLIGGWNIIDVITIYGTLDYTATNIGNQTFTISISCSTFSSLILARIN